MFIGTPWKKYYDDDLEEFRFPVYLTYFETKVLCLSTVEASKCRRRDGLEWVKPVSRWIIHRRVRDWLEQHIGHEDIVWPIDRIYYPTEVLPTIPTGSSYKWRQLGLETYGPEDQQWQFARLMAGQREDPSINNQFSNFIFKSAENAQKFYDAWKMAEAEWVVEYGLDHPMVGDGNTCSFAFTKWMMECVGPPADDVIDFIQGNGKWCFDFQVYEKETYGSRNRVCLFLWFRNKKDFTLTKLAWA